MQGKMIEFGAGDRQVPGYLALPENASGPGVLVIQEWWGLVDHIKAIADRFAAKGFVALAPDLYHGESTTRPDDAGRKMMALNIAEAGKDLRGAAENLLRPDAVVGKGVAAVGVKTPAYVTVMDLAPSFLELANADYPAGGKIQPMRGESINEFLAGQSETVHDENYVTVHSHGGRSLIRKGHWKLTNLEPPFIEAQFELFNLEVDPGETTNLADSELEKFQEMIDLWRTERKTLGIVLPQDL